MRPVEVRDRPLVRQLRMSAGARDVVELTPSPDDDPIGSTDLSSIDFAYV